jgi:hypothetical protein
MPVRVQLRIGVNLSTRKFGGYKSREEQLESKRKWWRNNLDRAKANNRNSRASISNMNSKTMLEAKSKPCKDCGGTFPPYVMEFDHARGNKRACLNSLKDKIKAFNIEMAKCDVVCANCHRIRTYLRRIPLDAGSGEAPTWGEMDH